MKERNIDFLLASVLMSIHFIQIYGLIYSERIGFPFNDDLYSIICSVCDIVRIFPLIENEAEASPIYYWIMAYMLIIILILYYIILVFIDYSIKIGKFYFLFPIKIVRYCSTFIFWVLMMPIINTFISIFSCVDGYHYID